MRESLVTSPYLTHEIHLRIVLSLSLCPSYVIIGLACTFVTLYTVRNFSLLSGLPLLNAPSLPTCDY